MKAIGATLKSQLQQWFLNAPPKSPPNPTSAGVSFRAPFRADRRPRSYPSKRLTIRASIRTDTAYGSRSPTPGSNLGSFGTCGTAARERWVSVPCIRSVSRTRAIAPSEPGSSSWMGNCNDAGACRGPVALAARARFGRQHIRGGERLSARLRCLQRHARGRLGVQRVDPADIRQSIHLSRRDRRQRPFAYGEAAIASEIAAWRDRARFSIDLSGLVRGLSALSPRYCRSCPRTRYSHMVARMVRARPDNGTLCSRPAFVR
jgi:hypothetical protein